MKKIYNTCKVIGGLLMLSSMILLICLLWFDPIFILKLIATNLVLMFTMYVFERAAKEGIND